MDNPVGGIKRGWEQIRSVSSGKYRFEFYHYSYHEAGDVFYVVGRERGEYRAGEVVLHMGIRPSEVFSANRWRMAADSPSWFYRGFTAVSCIRVPQRLEIVSS
jgi:ketosteroid isomerase-like protein